MANQMKAGGLRGNLCEGLSILVAGRGCCVLLHLLRGPQHPLPHGLALGLCTTGATFPCAALRVDVAGSFPAKHTYFVSASVN